MSSDNFENPDTPTFDYDYNMPEETTEMFDTIESSDNNKLNKPLSNKRPSSSRASDQHSRNNSEQELFDTSNLSSPTTPNDDNKGSRRASGSFVIKGDLNLKDQLKNAKLKLTESESKLKQLTRDNKVLSRNIEKLKATGAQKSQVVDKEKEMRLEANRERYSLQEKLKRMQMAIQARLKLLGVDFTKCNDLGEALDAAFAAIQKLTAELQKKEEEMASMQTHLEQVQKSKDDQTQRLTRMEKQLAKHKEELDRHRDELEKKDRRLSEFGHSKDDVEASKKKLEQQLENAKKRLKDEQEANAKHLEEFAQQRAKLENALEKKTGNISQLEKSLEDFRQENEKFQSELEKAKRKIKEMEKTLQTRDKHNTELTDRIKQLEDENSRLDKQSKQQQRDSDQGNKKLERELELEKQTHQQDVQKLTKETQNLRSEIERIENERDDLAKKQKILSQDKESVTETMDALMTEKSQLFDMCQKLKKDKQDSQNVTKEKDIELNKLNKNLEDLKNELSLRGQDINKKDQKINELENTLNKTKSELNQLKQELDNTIKTKDDQIESLNDNVKNLQNELNHKNDQIQQKDSTIKELESMLSQTQEELNKLKKDSENTIRLKDDEIGQLNDSLENVKNDLTRKERELEETNQHVNDLENKLKNTQEELDQIRKELEEKTKQLDEILNKVKLDKSCQTDLSGDFIQTLNKSTDLIKENADLRKLISDVEDHCKKLTEENKQLLDEIDLLLKQAARFLPDAAPHSGEVYSLACSPTRYICATSASDSLVKLYHVNISENARDKQVQIYLGARTEGKCQSLAFSPNGRFLAGGCAYHDGPEGIILIWNVDDKEGEVDYLFRSRPTVRFGRVHSLCWSDDNRFIFSGDSTGNIWVWDTENFLQLANIQAHRDIVYDITVNKNLLFSVSHDQSLSKCDISDIKKIPIKKSKGKLLPHQPVSFKSEVLDTNGKYPYWRVSATEDNNYIVCGSRKIHVFKYDGKSIEEGPRITDTDLDHVYGLKLKKGRICICRQNTPRVKLFELSSGKELKKLQFKSPVIRLDFTHDLEHVVTCSQELQANNRPKPPVLNLSGFDDEK